MAISKSIPTISKQARFNFNFDNPYPYTHLLDLLQKGPMLKVEDGAWLATSYEAVNSIFRDKNFLTSNPALMMPQTILKNRNSLIKALATPPLKFLINRDKQVQITKSWLVFSNPPDHTRLRKLTQTAFTPRAIKALLPRVKEITYQLMDLLEEKQEFDLIKEFALPLPITLISEILGISQENTDQFKNWSKSILQGFQSITMNKDRSETLKAVTEIRSFLDDVISEKQSNPGEDVISYFITANEDNERLSRDEMISNIVLLLFAGHETTVNLIGNTLYALLANREQYELLLGDKSLVTNTTEESLRFDPPLITTIRRVKADMDFMGIPLKKNDVVDVAIFTANRDPQKFENPNAFDITRNNAKDHLAFGQGIHFCLGAPLARAEAEIAFSEIIDRFPHLQLSETKKPQRFNSFGFSSFAELYLTK